MHTYPAFRLGSTLGYDPPPLCGLKTAFPAVVRHQKTFAQKKEFEYCKAVERLLFAPCYQKETRGPSLAADGDSHPFSRFEWINPWQGRVGSEKG